MLGAAEDAEAVIGRDAELDGRHAVPERRRIWFRRARDPWRTGDREDDDLARCGRASR